MTELKKFLFWVAIWIIPAIGMTLLIIINNSMFTVMLGLIGGISSKYIFDKYTKLIN